MRVPGIAAHMCIEGVPVFGDPCDTCQEFVAAEVEEALLDVIHAAHSYHSGGISDVLALCGRVVPKAKAVGVYGPPHGATCPACVGVMGDSGG